MRRAVRWFVVVVTIIHGLIHLLGAAKGFQWAAVTELQDPISTTGGVVWLAASVLLVATGVLLAAGWRRWWTVGALAVTVSQIAIFTAFADAWAGTVANLILLVAVVYGFAADGPTGLRAEYRRMVGNALAVSPPTDLLTDADLVGLPAPVARYVRCSGAVGLPRVTNFRAQIHGRIRAAADAPWMTFVGEQVNTYGPRPARLFLIDATMSGLPVDVLHSFIGPTARMRVRLCSLLTMVDVTGPEMNRGETVTLFNDLCLFAPAALIDAPIEWELIDDHRVGASFTNGAETVRAELAFDADGELIDFVSDDRYRSIDNGKRFVAQRWSTPVDGHRTFGSRRAIARGSGHWHAPEPEGEFAYLEIEIDAIAHNVTADPTPVDRTPSAPTGVAPAVITSRSGPTCGPATNRSTTSG